VIKIYSYLCIYYHHSGVFFQINWGPSWSWWYGSWIVNYLCNQCLSPLMLWVRISIRTRCSTLYDKAKFVNDLDCRCLKPISIISMTITTGVIKSRKSKVRQYNGQKAKCKTMVDNSQHWLQNIQLADFKQTKCIYFISNFLFLLPIIRQWYEQDGTICKKNLNISIFIFILYWIIQFSPPGWKWI
jgi:hypothetical protein